MKNIKKSKKNRKKKGFTLIELLAVILILGIIALIAIPQVVSIIEGANKGAAETSAKVFLKAVNEKVPLSRLSGEEKLNDNSYSVSELYDKNLGLTGQEADGGYVQIENGAVSSGVVFINGYTVTYDNNTYTTTKGYLFKNGTPIYFNPETGSFCKASEAVSKNNTKTGCMKWYVFNDEEEKDTIDMILDHNTTVAAYWKGKNNYTNYTDGPIQAYNYLQSDTSSWIGVPERTDSYVYSNDSGATYTINYSGMHARFITANEIAKIVGLTSWDEKTKQIGDWFYFDGRDQTTYAHGLGTSEFGWLFDNIYNCGSYGCNINEPSLKHYGYWTASAVNGSTANVWRVTTKGRLFDDNAIPSNVNGRGGVRPVITISKDLLLKKEN